MKTKFACAVATCAALFTAGCMETPDHAAAADQAAAEACVRNAYSNVEMVKIAVEEPEYAAVSKVPDSHRTKPADSPATCGVRVRFTWRDENRTTHDDWVVWVTSDHKMIDWSSNPVGDKWRQYVQSAAKK